MKNFKLVALVAGTVAITAVSTSTLLNGASAQSRSSSVFQELDLFSNVFNRVRADYVEQVSDKKLIEAAINGMLSSLDPHSGYLDTQKYRDMQVQTRGEFGGLGIEVTLENGIVKVVSPIDETPAWRAGIQAGDLISHIDDEPVLGLTLNEAVERMRGPVNSDILLRIIRAGEDEPFDITLTRATIKISPVRARSEGTIGYVRLTTFNEQTSDKMREEIDDLRAEIGDELEGLVLDLRNNPGGLLEQAVEVADAFLDRGEIVSTRGRGQSDVQRYNARSGDVMEGLPVVVLINGGSASASEIVAGALQDHRRAIVLGTQSFGKGSVQTIMPVSNQGAIRLTTARYYTPAGTSIQARGIVPDIEVKRANVEILNEGNRRREADLRGRLDNDQSGGGDEQAAGDGTSDTPQDYQLSRAIDLLKGISLYDARLGSQPG